jgi:hypothetical protein
MMVIILVTIDAHAIALSGDLIRAGQVYTLLHDMYRCYCSLTCRAVIVNICRTYDGTGLFGFGIFIFIVFLSVYHT